MLVSINQKYLLFLFKAFLFTFGRGTDFSKKTPQIILFCNGPKRMVGISCNKKPNVHSWAFGRSENPALPVVIRWA